MLEIWKTIIERAVSWPVVILILGLIFKKPLTGLVSRINYIKGPGFDFSAPPASAQLTEEAAEPPAALKGEIVPAPLKTVTTPAPTAAGTDLAARKEAVRNFGKGFAIVDEEVETIKRQLATLEMPLGSEETARILIRHLATTQLMLRCERTHRLIYGSQIVALHLMNNGGPQPETAISPIFENARAQEPKFYGSYSFDDWIGFLIREVTAIKTEHGLYAVTVYGRTYLEYIGIFAPGPKAH